MTYKTFPRKRRKNFLLINNAKKKLLKVLCDEHRPKARGEKANLSEERNGRQANQKCAFALRSNEHGRRTLSTRRTEAIKASGKHGSVQEARGLLAMESAAPDASLRIARMRQPAVPAPSRQHQQAAHPLVGGVGDEDPRQPE